MLKPSKTLSTLRRAKIRKRRLYQVAGKVREMAQKPRFWQVTATPITTDGKQLDRTHIKFTTPSRAKLSELAPVINEHILSLDDF